MWNALLHIISFHVNIYNPVFTRLPSCLRVCCVQQTDHHPPDGVKGLA